jgi:hypothetical protein
MKNAVSCMLWMCTEWNMMERNGREIQMDEEVSIVEMQKKKKEIIEKKYPCWHC